MLEICACVRCSYVQGDNTDVVTVKVVSELLKILKELQFVLSGEVREDILTCCARRTDLLIRRRQVWIGRVTCTLV